MKSYEVLRQQQLDRMNRLRRIQRIINLPEFLDAWQTVTLQESQFVEALIALCQPDSLQTWLDHKCRKTFDEMTLVELRDIAKVHSIPYYASMNKATLIWEIHNAVNRATSVGNGILLSLGQHTC